MDFFDQNPQRRLRLAIAIHQRLQGQRALGFAGGSNDGFLDFHGVCVVL